MLFFETRAYQRAAADLGPEVVDRVRQRMERISKEDALGWPRHNGVRIYELRPFQVIGEFVPVGGTTVFCGLTVHRIDSPQQAAILGEGPRQAQRLLDSLPTDSDLEAFVASERAPDEDKVPLPLPDDLYHWLMPPSVDHLAAEAPESDGAGTSTVVFETPGWADGMATGHMRAYARPIYDLVVKAVDTPAGSHLQSRGVEVLRGPGYAIAYRWFAAQRPARRSILLLIKAFAPEPGENDVARCTDLLAGLEASADLAVVDIETTDVIARLARRTYPAYLLADPDLWIRLEGEAGLNAEQGLALSVEEVDLLFSVGTDANASLPLFINGRAGSGKSTMLAYLFASYWHHRFQTAEPATMRFLATNKQLLESAANTAIDLLKNRTGPAHDLSDVELKEIRESFIPFREFVTSLLPPQTRTRFEDPRREIRFADFTRLLQGRHATENPAHPRYAARPFRNESPVSAETAWYVIRTFAKGYGDRELDVDGYGSILTKDRVVTAEDFTRVMREIWEPWYQPLTNEQGFWDDQDLARAALDGLVDPMNEVPHPEVAVLFCDEAQDFTRLELKMLLRCSIFSKYDLSHSSPPALPFAFAGDPLQTINPTGFRWERMQDAFHEEIVVALGLGNSIRLQPTEFATNYRSEAQIVEFLNTINLARRDLFGLTGLTPQASWSTDGAAPPWEYIISQNVQTDDLETHLGSRPIVMVPWDVGNKIDEVKADELLGRLFPDASEESPPQNLLTAVEAKGLQFPVVILYKFGESCPEGVFANDRRAADSLTAEFFFNKLYVAASRAQDRLIVIDTPEGHERLWKPLNEYVERMADPTSPPDGTWETSIRGLAMGEPQAIVELSDVLDHAELARRFQAEAELTDSASLWRLAAQNYRTAGKQPDADRAEAWALYHEGRFAEATEQFWRLGAWEGAWRSAWSGLEWQRLDDWYRAATAPDADAKRAWRPLVAFLAAPNESIAALTAFLDHLLGQFSATPPKSLAHQVEWREGVSEFLDRLAAVGRDLDEEHVDFALDACDQLERARFSRVSEVAGRLAFVAKRWERAATFWERAGRTSSNDFLEAKARAAGFPAGLSWFRRRPSAFTDYAIEEWLNAGMPFNRAWMGTLAPQLEGKGRLLEAARGYLITDRMPEAYECLQRLAEQQEPGQGPRDEALSEEVAALLTDAGRRAGDLGAIDFIGTVLSRGHNQLGPLLGKRTSAAIRSFRYGAIHGLALRDELSERQRETLKSLQRRARRDQHVTRELEPLVLGLALERSESSLVEVLSYYERLQRGRGTDVRAARERWLVTKLRQVEWTQARLAESDASLREAPDAESQARLGARRKRFVDDADRQERAVRDNEREWRLTAATLPSREEFAQVYKAKLLPASQRFEASGFAAHSTVRVSDRTAPSSWQIDVANRRVGNEDLTVGDWTEVEGLFRVRITDETGARLEFQDLTGDYRIELIDLGDG